MRTIPILSLTALLTTAYPAFGVVPFRRATSVNVATPGAAVSVNASRGGIFRAPRVNVNVATPGVGVNVGGASFASRGFGGHVGHVGHVGFNTGYGFNRNFNRVVFRTFNTGYASRGFGGYASGLAYAAPPPAPVTDGGGVTYAPSVAAAPSYAPAQAPAAAPSYAPSYAPACDTGGCAPSAPPVTYAAPAPPVSYGCCGGCCGGQAAYYAPAPVAAPAPTCTYSAPAAYAAPAPTCGVAGYGATPSYGYASTYAAPSYGYGYSPGVAYYSRSFLPGYGGFGGFSYNGFNRGFAFRSNFYGAANVRVGVFRGRVGFRHR